MKVIYSALYTSRLLHKGYTGSSIVPATTALCLPLTYLHVYLRQHQFELRPDLHKHRLLNEQGAASFVLEATPLLWGHHKSLD